MFFDMKIMSRRNGGDSVNGSAGRVVHHQSRVTLFLYQGNKVYDSVYYKPSSDGFNEEEKKIHIFFNHRQW